MANEHFVPCCYLQHFCFSKKKNVRNSPIYVYDKKRNCTFVQSINSVASHESFYDMNILDNDAMLLEKFFTNIEGDFAAMLKSIDCRTEVLNQRFISCDEKQEIALYIALQYLRTDTIRNHFTMYIEQLKRLFPKDSEEYIYISRDNYSKHIHNLALLDLDFLVGLSNIFCNAKKWLFLINRSDLPFCTSDTPVTYNERRRDESIISPNLIFYYPLTTKVASALFDNCVRMQDCHWCTLINPVLIDYINALQVKNSLRFSFSSKILFTTS